MPEIGRIESGLHADTKRLEEMGNAIGDKLIELFDSVMEPGWIPVSERMPEDGKMVVVYGPACRERDIGYHYKRRWVVGFAGSCLESRITHWMPLPEPPTDVTEQT